MDCNHRLRSCSLSRPRLFIIASLVFVFLLFQFVTIDELQIIHFKHRQGGKRLEPDQFDSTCSRAADQRGPHQKIISYSIYGNFCRAEIAKKYLKPFIQTLTRIPSVYPGWVVRIYHNVTKDDGETWNMINNTLNLGNHIDFCNATEIIRNRKLADIFAMTWRWLPLLDNMVDTLMSRDSDSYIITREADAVQAWLAGDRAFHIMRDHPSHCRFIVGCCWGVKVSQNRSSIVRAATSMFTQNHLHEYDYDQKLLDKLIWPIAYNNMIAHDSYCCERLPLTHPYPTKRKDGLFIGWRAVPKEELQFPCPPKCRPANTSDWSFC
ncbi:uncharacterized protein LOC116934719 isoform X2 [Daphnia magna]|uniref:uncharacterized protein LOC116934719 isoform X2 n=1 Tax=Daphnia magna TaxID=35525 RepID=UPI0014025EDF|nr:uncharacterized protein LOC116934719 isoform X2 [Daphnia magna]